MRKAPIVLCVLVAWVVASAAWLATVKLLGGPAVLDQVVGLVAWGVVFAAVYTWLRDGWPALVGVFRRTRRPSTSTTEL